MTTPKAPKPKKFKPTAEFLPGPKTARTYRISTELKAQASEAAERLGLSENDIIESAVAWYLDALQTQGLV
jgi:positive regulator of sigma E activity